MFRRCFAGLEDSVPIDGWILRQVFRSRYERSQAIIISINPIRLLDHTMRAIMGCHLPWEVEPWELFKIMCCWMNCLFVRSPPSLETQYAHSCQEGNYHQFIKFARNVGKVRKYGVRSNEANIARLV